MNRITRRLTSFAPLAVLALAAGCGTGQIERLVRSDDLSASRLASIEPAELRVAVMLPLPSRPARESAALGIHEAATDGEIESLPLLLVAEGETLRANLLPSAQSGYRWFLFKLTVPAEEALAQRRADLAGNASHVLMRVATPLEGAAPGQTISRAVWIQLREDESFFPIVESEEVRVGADGEAA